MTPVEWGDVLLIGLLGLYLLGVWCIRDRYGFGIFCLVISGLWVGVAIAAAVIDGLSPPYSWDPVQYLLFRYTLGLPVTIMGTVTDALGLRPGNAGLILLVIFLALALFAVGSLPNIIRRQQTQNPDTGRS
jgi:hypothetical protein